MVSSPADAVLRHPWKMAQSVLPPEMAVNSKDSIFN
jgi:hypothetical protein